MCMNLSEQANVSYRVSCVYSMPKSLTLTQVQFVSSGSNQMLQEKSLDESMKKTD